MPRILETAVKLLAMAIIVIIFSFSAVWAKPIMTLTSGDVTWTFDTHAGLRLVNVNRVSNGKVHSVIDHPEGRPLFDLAVTSILPATAKMNDKGGYDWKPGPGLIDPASFKVISAENLTINRKNAVEFKMYAATSAGGITGDIRVVAQGDGEVVFFTKIKPESSDYYLKNHYLRFLLNIDAVKFPFFIQVA